MKLEVLCINKSLRINVHERITHIGGKNADGTKWRLPQEKVISLIENNERQFFVNRGGKAINVIVAKSFHGHKYIKTETDGIEANNLLSLPECS